MINLNIDFDKFIEDNWKSQKPIVIRNMVDSIDLAKFSYVNIKENIDSSVKADLFFHNYNKTGKTLRRKIPNANLIPSLINKYDAQGEEIILYLFNFDRKSKAYSSLRESLRFGYDFRYYSSLISISNNRSVIPAHFDFIDSLVFQIEGTRRWKIWDYSNLSNEQLIQLNNLKGNDLSIMKSMNLVEEIDLYPGDVLFLPALFGHEGITTSEFAVSYSSGWTSYSPYRIAKAVSPEFLKLCIGQNPHREFYLPINMKELTNYSQYFINSKIITKDNPIVQIIMNLDYKELYRLP